jgi:hypothetical protein
MENMDKDLTVPKWVLIVRAKIPQMPHKNSDQNVCPSSKVQDFWKKLSLGVRSPCAHQIKLWTYESCFHQFFHQYLLQLNECETASYFIQLSQNLKSDCLFQNWENKKALLTKKIFWDQ